MFEAMRSCRLSAIAAASAMAACGSGMICDNPSYLYGSGPAKLCGGQCTGTDHDPVNCGSCGHACLQGETCAGGSCAPCTLSLTGALSQSSACSVMASSFDGVDTLTISSGATLTVTVVLSIGTHTISTGGLGISKVQLRSGTKLWQADAQAGSASITITAADLASRPTSPCCFGYAVHGSLHATLVELNGDVETADSTF
jgi:hypothetical protein